MCPPEPTQRRSESYNATVVSVHKCHDDLMILRVRPDGGVPQFLAGQYTILGLRLGEPSVFAVPRGTIRGVDQEKIVKRAYSISCRMLDDTGKLVTAYDLGYFEFYISLVRQGTPNKAPTLTPRLFALRENDRLLCGPRIHGNYTLQRVRPDDDVILVSTGTGEAPHNAMVAQLLCSQHRGRIVVVSCFRFKIDQAYLSVHRRLEQRFENYRYLPLTTREPENLDATLPAYVGKRHVQDYFLSRQFEHDTQMELAPHKTHIFLCGSPQMIGAPIYNRDSGRRYPSPLGMVEVLEDRGFEIDRPQHPGNIHYEKYW